MTVTPGAAWLLGRPTTDSLGAPFFAEAAPAAQRQHAAHRSGSFVFAICSAQSPARSGAARSSPRVHAGGLAIGAASDQQIDDTCEHSSVPLLRTTLNGKLGQPDLRESALNFQVKSRWRATGDGTTIKARVIRVSPKAGAVFCASLVSQQAADQVSVDRD
jgi:hypothetical protein